MILGDDVPGDLARGDQLVAWDQNVVRERRVAKLIDSGTVTEMLLNEPVGNVSAIKVNKWRRKFRLFGHQVPEQFVVALDPVSNGFHTRNFDGKVNHVDGKGFALEGVIADLQPGAQVLVSSHLEEDPVEIESVETHHAKIPADENDIITPFQGKVTYVKFKGDPFAKLEAWDVTLYELDGDEIPVWGLEYPSSIQGTQLFVPSRAFPEELVRTLQAPGESAELAAEPFLGNVLIADESGMAHRTTVIEVDVKTENHRKHVMLTLPSSLPEATTGEVRFVRKPCRGNSRRINP